MAGGCGGEELDQAVEELEDAAGENDAQYRDRIRKVRLGMTTDEVRSIMDEAPRDRQRQKSEFGTSQYWYYGSWQLGFTDGVLDSKNRY